MYKAAFALTLMLFAATPANAFGFGSPKVESLGGGLYMATGRQAGNTIRAAVKLCARKRRRYKAESIQSVPRGIWTWYGGARSVISDTVVTFRCR